MGLLNRARAADLSPNGSGCRGSDMKTPCLPVVGAAMSALLILAPAGAAAQRQPVGSVRSPSPPHHGGGHGIHVPFIILERETVVERKVEPDQKPAEQPAAVEPPPPPREPFVIGRSYSSLPGGGCLKLIEDGISYYSCSGEWYRQVGAQYKAVAKP
jgi:hypothetical protein